MLVGKTTIEHLEECLKKGFCKEHKKELRGIEFGNREAQRKAILFLRLQVFSPILFRKPFTFEKMKVLFQDHSFYGKSDNPETEPEFLENILYLDAIIVYTICHFSKICCPGILFKQTKDISEHCKDKHLLSILQKKDIAASEIGFLVPDFTENFDGKRENLYKLGYVATMLLVRNVSSRIELKCAIERLDRELNNIPTECEKWFDIGLGEKFKHQYEEAIEAYTCGLKYSSYAICLLYERAEMHLRIENFKEAAVDSYRVLMIHSNGVHLEALFSLAKSFYGMSLFDECLGTLEYALQNCHNANQRDQLEGFKRLATGIRMVKMANKAYNEERAAMNKEASNEQQDTERITSNGCQAGEVKKDIPELIEASDSEEEDVPELMEASNSSDESSSDSENSEDQACSIPENCISPKEELKETLEEAQKNWPPLSEGAIDRFIRGEDVQKPVLQILGCVKMQGLKQSGMNQYRLLISDGVTGDPFTMLQPQLNHLVTKNKLQKFTIIGVDEWCYTKSLLGNGGFIDLLSIEVLVPGNKVNKKLGNPINRSTTEGKPSSDSGTIETQLMNGQDSSTSDPAIQSDSIPDANVEDEPTSKRIKRLVTEATQNLLSENLVAIQLYRDALDEIKAFPKEHEYCENDIIRIKYALGISFMKSGGYDELQKAISTFKAIAEDHCSVIFPAAYYGIALANQKLNRFKDALHYLQIVEDILQGSGTVKEYTWPESSTIIKETVTEKLKAYVADLMSECENPPTPEATCRFQDCSLQPAIYYSDPDFKGFFAIQCSSHCTLQYHPNCWRLLKTEKHFSDKEFLDQSCLTPDCDGFIIKIQNIDKDQEIKRVFESAESKKCTRKKSKLEKKLEVKEGKRQKRKDSSGRSRSESTSESVNDTDQPETTTDHSLENHCKKSDAKTERNDGPSSSKDTPVYPETFTVIKKEKIVHENSNKTSSKVKENKKKGNTISIGEFLDNHDSYGLANDYQQIRENTVNKSKSNIVLKPTAPAFEPQRTINSAQNQVSYKSEDFPRMPAHLSISANPNDTKVVEATGFTSPAFNPAMLLPPEFSIECAKKNIYSYLKNILYKHGPLKEDDPILVQELQGFPGEANALIADCGGLGRFLQQSVDFAFVGEEYVCTVDQIAQAYDKKNNPNITSIAKDFSVLDGYASYSNPEDFKGYGDSPLNPDAQEYNPAITKSGRNSPHMLSAISKLRQPLAVDEESAKPIQTNTSVSEVAADSFSFSETTDKFPTKLQLAHKCADAVRGYFSPEAGDFRGYIQKFIYPYAIVEATKKSNVNVQTDNIEYETLLKNAKKSEEELQRLKELVNCLTEQSASLKEQNVLLGEQCTLALDNVTKFQNKSSVELLSLKKELEEANLALEDQAKVFKSKESKLEKEIKALTETLKKNKDDEASQKSEISSLQATNKDLEARLSTAEDRIEFLSNEKRVIKMTLDIQNNKLKENVKSLESEKAKVLSRAEAAELKLLEVQKKAYLKVVDGKAADAVKRMKELQTGIALHKPNLNPVYATNFLALLKQIESYIAKLATIRTEFTKNIDEQYNSVKKGTPLESLQPLEMTELPEIPTWSQVQSMQNGAIPSAQAQFLNFPIQTLQSALTNQLPTANNYFNTPINAPTQMPIGTPAARQPAYPSANSTNQGTIPKTSQTKKLPPGLSEPVKDQETVAKKEQAQVMPAKQQASTMPKKQQAVAKEAVGGKSVANDKAIGSKSKASSSGTQSLGASTLSLASGISKSSTDLKKSCDSLELDYNIKKSTAKAAKIPEPAATVSSKSSSNKKSYEKLMARLRVIYPEATQAQITAMVKDFRSAKNSLSGLTIDMIINEIVAMVEAKKKEENKKNAELAQKLRQNVPNKPLVNRKLSEDVAKEAETRAKKAACAWGVAGDSSKQWHGKDIDEPCTICFEEMNSTTAYKVDCGHTFHRTCIQEWINKKSDCPICRVHLLLPEDYPAL